MSIAFLYPGQGAQFAGMLHQLPERAEVKEDIAGGKSGSWSRRSSAGYGKGIFVDGAGSTCHFCFRGWP